MSKEQAAAGGAPVEGRILLVDAHSASLKRSQEILSEAGFRVEAASSPEEVLGDRSVDVVFLFEADSRSRKTAVASMRERIGQKEVPVVLVLAKKSQGSGRASGSQGADATLARPVAPLSLVAVATAFTQAAELRRRLAERERQLEQALQEGGRVDPRTGFYAFDAFKSLLAAEVKRARRYKYPFSIAIAAFDKMGEVRKGHGDELADLLEGGLRLAISRSLRDLDLPVAYGEGQVLVVMPHTPRRGARVMTDRMRRRVARTKLTCPDGKLGTTISVGIASYECVGEVSFGSLAQEAAAALKIAVEHGGNRVAEVPVTRRKAMLRAAACS